MSKAKRRKENLDEAKRQKKKFDKTKRRKEKLCRKCGTTPTSKMQIPRDLKPDYGHHIVNTIGVFPINILITNPMVVVGKKEGHICFSAGNYMGSIIVTPEFAEYYKNNNGEMLLKVIPDPDDAYVTSLGERVIPFKLIDQEDD